MRRSFIPLSLGIVFLATTMPLLAQREIPLSRNPVLARSLSSEQADTPVFRVKTTCGEPEGGGAEVLAGQATNVQVLLDTLGFGIDGYYDCTNCAELNFGVVSLSGDTLQYTANAGVLAGRDTVRIRYCNMAGDSCSRVSNFAFVAQRPGTNIYPPAISLDAEAQIELTALNELPGDLLCATFADCADDYDGTEQLVYLTDYDTPVSTFVYQASRWAGVDSVCVVLCDVNGICDTAHYAFRISVPSFDLTTDNIFMDDFSDGAAVTKSDYWLDRAVYVNKELGYEPPSIGVASFDGLNYRGRPYPENEEEIADILTSTYIDIDNNGNIPQLAFWIQRGGLADRPETSDSLLLQFRTIEGKWETVWNLNGISNSQPLSEIDPFQFVVVPVDGRYQHSRYQFRFLNKGSGGGIRDTWHLDYVRLSYSTEGASFNDQAFTQQPAFLLDRYTSMPWSHFQLDPAAALSMELPVGVYNHDRTGAGRIINTSANDGYGLMGEDLVSGQSPFTPVDLLSGGDENLNQGRTNYLFDFSNQAPYSNAWNDIVQATTNGTFAGQEEVRLQLTYAMDHAGQANTESAITNDQVSRTTVLENYFAYDDGTAESALEVGPTQQLAIEFESAIDDTLRGVQIHFPHTGADVEAQSFRFKVWLDSLNTEPVYEGDFQPYFTTTFFDTLQGFTSYPLVDFDGEEVAVPLPAGKFYVGWEQLTNCTFAQCIGIGYDRNQPDARDYIFREGNTGWEPIVGISRGALMVRPVVGSEAVLPTATEEVLRMDSPVRLYPNPTRETVHLLGWENLSPDTGVSLYNSAGQLLLESPLLPQLQLPKLPTGLYFLRFHDPPTGRHWVDRLIIE